jgi:hypothetical protein
LHTLLCELFTHQSKKRRLGVAAPKLRTGHYDSFLRRKAKYKVPTTVFDYSTPMIEVHSARLADKGRTTAISL